MHYYRLGLIGHPVAHTRSPGMHLAALKHFGLEGSYDAIDIGPLELAGGIERLVAVGFTGFNVTIPHKEKVVHLVNRLSQEAEVSGAVNTIKVEADGQTCGYNTDAYGFTAALTKLMGQVEQNMHACIVGSGGSARAIMYALNGLGCRRVTIVSRNVGAASAMSGAFSTGRFSKPGLTAGATAFGAGPRTRTLPCTDTFEELAGASLIVNCTPIGLDIDGEPVPDWYRRIYTKCRETACFFDLVYGQNGSTPLVKLAQECGLARVCDGSAMLAGQAAKAFEIWTGQLPPIEVMESALGVTN